jgi:hypothetical protein
MTTTTPSKTPNAACEMQRNRVDTAVFTFIEKHGPINYHFVLGAGDLPFDNREIRGSIKRLRRGGRIDLEHWYEKRVNPKGEDYKSPQHGLALKKTNTSERGLSASS